MKSFRDSIRQLSPCGLIDTFSSQKVDWSLLACSISTSPGRGEPCEPMHKHEHDITDMGVAMTGDYKLI